MVISVISVILVSNSHWIWWHCFGGTGSFGYVWWNQAEFDPRLQDLLVQDSIAAAGFGTRVPRHCLLEFWIEFLAFNFNVFLLGELVRNE